MAEDKKGFVLYADLIHTVSKMPNDKAGELLKHILSYVNDEDPTTEDLIVQLTFEPIKQQLKRDLKKYQSTKKERSISGQLGNLKRYHKHLYDKVKSDEITLETALKIVEDNKTSHSDTKLSHSDTKLAVTDTVNVTVKDTVIVNDKIDKSIYYKTEKEFLDDWNDARIKMKIAQFSNFNALYTDESENFKELQFKYTKEQFKNGLRGLFMQKDLFESMSSRPKHFLSNLNIEKYIDAKLNDIQLYETKNKYDVKL